MTEFDKIFASFQGRRVAVLGIGISNRPLLRLLLSAGAKVTVCDKQPREKLDGGLCTELALRGAEFCCGDEYLDHLDQEVIFRSPGIMSSNPALEEAKHKGACVTSEMELFFRTCPCPIIAVTGSDGKSTTTTLIYEMLKAQGYRVHLGGNIGRPLLSDVPQIGPDDFAVAELSSFQLMSMTQSPSVAVITNITPNHLDKHKDLQEYIDAKANIWAWQKPGDRVVLNLDNPVTAGMIGRCADRAIPFSRTQDRTTGCVIRNGMITLWKDGVEKPLLALKDILLPGLHNVENYMAACAAVEPFVSPENMTVVARSFAGVPHRLELVRELNGVRYYNSSIDSSPTRTAAALSCFENRVIVIAGGADKGIPLEPLGDLFAKKAKGCILVGKTAERIRDAVLSSEFYDEKTTPVCIEKNMDDAVHRAFAQAAAGDTVILSPGCTSFDLYHNFEERGERFRTAVQSLCSETV